MKKLSVVLLFLVFGPAVFAQDNKIDAGLGPEWNMNSPHNFAAGAVLNFNYNLPGDFAVGFNLGASTNFFGVKVIEAGALLRNYVLRGDHSGLFLQIDAGTFIIHEDGDVIYLIELGVRGGYRFHLGSLFYVDPYIRFGYPFAFGIGVMAGFRF